MKNNFIYHAEMNAGRWKPIGIQNPHSLINPIHKYFKLILLVMVMVLWTSCESSFDEPEIIALQQDQDTGEFGDGHARHGLPSAEIARLRNAVAGYHNMEKAIEDGYTVQATDYFTQMGYHYLNPALLDDQFELEKPELLLYAPSPSGKLKLVAVEYATPIEDLNNPPPPPEGFSGDADVWTINSDFSLWTLHVWTTLQNPDGIFASHNPRLP
jgi:hypothetical protein